MRALTPQMWAEHHQDLGDAVTQRWPALTSAQLQAVGGDFDALAGAVADADGSDVDEARRALMTVEVDERELGASDPGQGLEETPGQASLAQLRLGSGFGDDDRDLVVGILEKLERRLERFPADATEMEISVKNRGATDQKVTLEAWLPRLPRFAVTSEEPDIRLALASVRDALWRQIEDTLGKRRPYD